MHDIVFLKLITIILCFSFVVHFLLLPQKTELIKNIEKLTFWAGDNEKLHFAKQELLSQINNLDISISGKGFFIINRQFLAGASIVSVTHTHARHFFPFSSFFFPF